MSLTGKTGGVAQVKAAERPDEYPRLVLDYWVIENSKKSLSTAKAARK